MENLKWTDKIDKGSDIEAKDVNSLANAIITIIDWINQDGGSSNIDLSEYVKKEDGKGLSKVLDIEGGGSENEEWGVYEELLVTMNDEDNTTKIFEYHTPSQIEQKLKLKRDKSVITFNDLTEDIDIILQANVESYLTNSITDTTIHITDVNSLNIGDSYYMSFTSGNVAPQIVAPNAPIAVRFVGDDCNSNGEFTPKTSMRYEIDFKRIGSGVVIARVGAC